MAALTALVATRLEVRYVTRTECDWSIDLNQVLTNKAWCAFGPGKAQNKKIFLNPHTPSITATDYLRGTSHFSYSCTTSELSGVLIFCLGRVTISDFPDKDFDLARAVDLRAEIEIRNHGGREELL